MASITGLSHQEAQARLAEYGPNILERAVPRSAWRILCDQFLNPLVVLLLAVIAISIAIGHFTDAAIIVAIVILNAVIGFVQEFRAERTMQGIRQLTTPHAKVRRSGQVLSIAAAELVPGDIVLVEAGDRIPADLRWIEAMRMAVDESLLTGESAPVVKDANPLSQADLPLGEQHNMGFMGTHVSSGRGIGLCVATGSRTQLGRIADLLESEDVAEVPLRRRLHRLTRYLVALALVLCTLLFAVGIIRGEPVVPMLVSAITLAVAAIPEGLTAVITISLSLGSLRLARQGVLVRRLHAVETLGMITVICADKTGTLTENRMTVRYPDPEDVVPDTAFLQALVLCNDARIEDAHNKALGDPMEIALLYFAEQHGMDSERSRASYARLGEIPFDTERKRMATLYAIDGDSVVFVKGAPEIVLSLCVDDCSTGTVSPLTQERRQALYTLQEQLSANGLRVLAFAMKRKVPRDDAAAWEQDLSFLGMVGLQDPPRAEVKAAIADCYSAGIRPVMITGDYKTTALAIGKELGIYREGFDVIEGAELKRDGFEGMRDRLGKVAVFARVSPEDKLTIIDALKQQGNVVAMTGDGVNDAPALRKADVGIAMGRGTDVAKEASALILVQENFATIVRAIHEGRLIYDNIRKFVRYMLTTNWGEIATMLVAMMVGLPLPLLPVHILWINLVTDGLPAIALGFEPPEGDVMARKPRPPEETILSQGLWQHTLWVGTLMGLLTMGVAAFFHATGESLAQVRSIAFSTLTFVQMGHVLAIRSERYPLWRIGLWSNPRLMGAIGLTVVAQLALLFVPALQAIFHTVSLSGTELAMSALPALVIYVAVEIEKFLKTALR